MSRRKRKGMRRNVLGGFNLPERGNYKGYKAGKLTNFARKPKRIKRRKGTIL